MKWERSHEQAVWRTKEDHDQTDRAVFGVCFGADDPADLECLPAGSQG